MKLLETIRFNEINSVKKFISIRWEKYIIIIYVQ